MSLVLLVLFALVLAVSPGMAQSGETAPPAPAKLDASYELAWWPVDGGGETLSSGGRYGLGSTVGSPDAGAPAGSRYGLGGGFWGGGEVAEPYDSYLPLVLRNH